MRQPPRKIAGDAQTPRRFQGKLLDITGVAELLGTSEKCIRARVARKLIPCRRLGGRIIFVRSEIEEFINALPSIVSIKEAFGNERIRRGHQDGYM